MRKNPLGELIGDLLGLQGLKIIFEVSPRKKRRRRSRRPHSLHWLAWVIEEHCLKEGWDITDADVFANDTTAEIACKRPGPHRAQDEAAEEGVSGDDNERSDVEQMDVEDVDLSKDGQHPQDVDLAWGLQVYAMERWGLSMPVARAVSKSGVIRFINAVRAAHRIAGRDAAATKPAEPATAATEVHSINPERMAAVLVEEFGVSPDLAASWTKADFE